MSIPRNLSVLATSINASGILGIAAGGTGAATLTANNVLLGNGTSAVQAVAPSTSGNVLTSNGTTWVSTTPSGGSTLVISNISAAYTVVAGDAGKIINCTAGTFTISLTSAATLGSGFNVTIWNTSATATDAITIDPSGAETVDGSATLVLQRGEGMQIVCDGTNWQTGDKKTMRGYAENFAPSQAKPTASGTNSLSIGVATTATATGSVAVGRNANATGNYSAAFGSGFISNVAAVSAYSTAVGNNSGGNGSQAVTGSGAMALGGSYASGTDSFAAAVANNTSSYGAKGTNSVAIGRLASASSSDAVAIGVSARASSTNAVAIGANAIASFSGSLAISTSGTGWGTQATAASAIAIGDGAKSTIVGKYVLANGCSSTAVGDMQTGTLILAAYTTDATPYVMRSYTYSGASATNQLVLPNSSAYAFSGLIVARRKALDGTQSAAWKVEGLIRREGSAGTTVLVNSALTVLDNTPGWTLALSADTTNGGLAITFTGAAATNIRTVATIQTSEVTYA